jgi:hypothetical protein
VVSSYNILVESESGKTKFIYYTSLNDRSENKALDKDGLDFALYCFLSDATAGAMSLDDFFSEFGYDQSKKNISEIIEIHEACRESFLKATTKLSLSLNNIYALMADLQEHYNC